MKKFHYYWGLIAFILLAIPACSSGGEELPEPAPKPEADKITLSSSSFSVEAKGGTINFTLTSNKTWTATSDQSWCTVSTTSGNSGTIALSATIAENPNEKERTAKITFKAGSASAVATVKQAEKEGNKTDSNNGDVAGMENIKW